MNKDRTVSERLEDLHKRRGMKYAAMQEIMDKAEREGRVCSDDENAAFKQLKDEIEQIDTHAKNLQAMEDTLARSAKPVVRHATRNTELEKGIGFVRFMGLVANTRGNDMAAREIATRMFPEQPDLARIFEARALGIIPRAAIAPATTTDPAWAGTLVYANQLSGELIELVRNEAILGKLSLREVPFNVRISRETLLIGTAAWVGEGAPKPFGKGGFDFITMPWTKAALIVAFTEELARFSDPSAERLMRDGLVEAIASFLDTSFISANAAVAGIAPAGILNGLPAGQSFGSSGNTPAHVQWDLTHAMGLLQPAKRPAWLMNTHTATSIGGMQNALGVQAFSTVSTTGGTLLGAPVVASLAIPANIIILLDQQMILHAADPGVAVDVSREATVNLDSAPTIPPAAGTQSINLWQNNMIGLRAEKFEHWIRGRDTSVVTITGVDYSAAPVGAGVTVTPNPARKAA